MPLRIAVMGTGRIAGKVTPFIAAAERCEVVLAASRDAARARAFAGEHGLAASCTYDELAERTDVDAVYLTLPNLDHPSWAERLLRAGKHVLCEKPLCWSGATAERLYDLAAERRLALVEAFMYLHNPLTAEARRLAQRAMHDPDASPIGRLVSVEAAFNVSIADAHLGNPVDNIRFSRALAGGAMMDLGCYPLSIARHLTGEEPGALEAEADLIDLFAASPRDGTDAVDARTRVRGSFSSGVSFDLECSMVADPARGPLVVARLMGDLGEVVIHDFPRPERLVISTHSEGERVIESPVADPMDVYRLQAESFAAAAGGLDAGTGTDPLPTPAWSIAQARAMERVLAAIGLRFDGPTPG